MSLALLALIVFGASLTEAALGFGSTVLTVALGAHLVPLGVLLPAVVPVNMALSAAIVLRHRDAVDGRLLVRRILPLMGAGFPVGLMLFHLGSDALLCGLFGGLVATLAAIELVRLRRSEASRPLSPIGGASLLVAGGVVHGIYGSGGPLVVYVAGREPLGKRRFRSTLSVLWLLFGAALLASYAASGALTAETGKMSLALAVPVALGLLAGEALHARVPERPFRIGVYALLLGAGAVLVQRGAL